MNHNKDPYTDIITCTSSDEPRHPGVQFMQNVVGPGHKRIYVLLMLKE
jgi:hypothetical protein